MKKIIVNVLIIPLVVLSVNAQSDFNLNRISASNINVSGKNANIQSTPLLLSKNINNVYDFPVKPGTAEWKKFDNAIEMVKACQVPEQILGKISTASLVESILNYPLFWTTIISNNSGTQQGFNILVSQFNGLRELLNRRDAGRELLIKYRAVPPLKKGVTDIEIGDYFFYCYSIEILFAQNEIRAGLSETQLQELNKELLAKYEARKELKEDGGFSKEMAVLNDILSQENYLKSAATTISTPKGSSVAAVQMKASDEMSQRDMIHCNMNYDSVYPKAKRETNCTKMYNCHSYAWYNQSTTNTVWINSPNQTTYWTDGSYSLWLGTEILPGMKLNYSRDDHSAIFVYGANPASDPYNATCRSKWGSGPRMLHTCSDSPYIATGITVYRSVN